MSVITGAEEIFHSGTMHIFPNPSPGDFVLGNLPASVHSVEIYSATGEKIYDEENVHEPSHSVKSNLSPGLYLVKISDGKNLFSEKLIVR